MNIFLVGFLQIFFRPEQYESTRFGDLKPYIWQWVWIGVLEGCWLFLTFFVWVPGCRHGYLGPGGLHDNSKHWNCTGGAAGWIDQRFFGLNHIYNEPTSLKIYQPEQYYGFDTTQQASGGPIYNFYY